MTCLSPHSEGPFLSQGVSAVSHRATREIHIHFDSDAVVVTATVPDDRTREEILRSCRQVASGRQLVDQIRIETAGAVEAVS